MGEETVMLAAVKKSIVWSDEDIGEYVSSEILELQDLLTSLGTDEIELWLAAEQQLIEIAQLEDDWDGLGAEAPEPEILESAIELLSNLRSIHRSPPPVHIVASANGTILFEWQGEGFYSEVEVVEPGHAACMAQSAGGPVTHWEESWSSSQGQMQQERQDALWEPYFQISQGDLAVGF